MFNKEFSTVQQLKILWNNLDLRRKKQLIILSILMIIVSIAEMISLGSIVPFLSVLTNPEIVYNHYFMQPLVNFFEISSPKELYLPVTIFLIVAVISAGLIRLLNVWILTRLSMSLGADFSIKVYEKTLYQPYRNHVLRNSSEILSGLNKASGLSNYLIKPVLTLISSTLISSSILTALFFVNAKISFIALFSFGSIYFILLRITKNSVATKGRIVAKQSIRFTKAIQEGLGAIRDIIIDNSFFLHIKQYNDSFRSYTTSKAQIQILGISPKIGVESLGIIIIALIAFFSTESENGLVSLIPTLGALALGAQRLLPLLQQIYESIISIKGNKANAQDAIDLLIQKIPIYKKKKNIKPLDFSKKIELSNISFKYSEKEPTIFNNLNLNINKGDRVGIIGQTGTGKSTLSDIIMGLIEPNSGHIFVDNVKLDKKNISAWQKNISHVPQSIFLIDSTIAENIAFNIPKEKINWDRIYEVSKMAQIDSTIKKFDMGYNTVIGERGVRLSGGQRQRIGIARSLYKKTDLIILDEATSALDTETENDLIDVIKGLSKDITLLFITHRLSSLSVCNKIYNIVNNNLEEIEFKNSSLKSESVQFKSTNNVNK